MKNEKNKKTIAGIFSLAIIIIAIAGFYYLYYLPEAQKDSVEEAVNLHIEYYNTRNIDGYYDQVSQYSKDTYNITLEDVIQLLNTAEFQGRDITLINLSQVEIEGNIADVKGVIIIRDNQGSQSGEFNQRYRLENGVWKYEMIK